MLHHLIIVALDRFRAIKLSRSTTKIGLSIAICSVFICYTSSSWSTPWIDAGDSRTRHHLQYLKDTGIITLSLTTWPLAWSDVNYELDDVMVDTLDKAQLWSYHYIKHELNQAKRRFKTTKTIYAANSPIPFTHFASESREDITLKSKTSFINDHFAITFNAQLVEDKHDEGKIDFKYDGSFAAVSLGNWIVGAGAIDRWWGPGWHSSLILSNNARPTPGVFLKRKTSMQGSSKYTSGFGNWTFDAFANTLKNDYESSKPKLIGARLSISPFSFLDLAYSRMGLWGGRGTTENSDTFQDFLSADNTTVEGAPGDDLAAEQQSNQLFSYDARINGAIHKVSLSLYGQHITNETLRHADAESATMFGMESAFRYGAMHNRLAIELSDTENASLTDTSPIGNAIYDHPNYRNGYRYRDRTLGESAGTNAKKISLLGEHFLANGHQLGWHLITVEANRRASSSNMYGEDAIDQRLFQLTYKFPVSTKTMMSFGVFFLDEDMKIKTQEINSGAYFELKFRL